MNKFFAFSLNVVTIMKQLKTNDSHWHRCVSTSGHGVRYNTESCKFSLIFQDCPMNDIFTLVR